MESQVLAAVVSGATALVVALIALVQSRRNQAAQSHAALDLEKLRSEMATKRSEADARRDYRYEARKRLYTEVSPLLFQLSELADAARHEIRRLSDQSNWVRLAMEDDARESLATRGWIGSTAYDTIFAAYALLAPLASYRFLQRRMTFLDLTLDQGIFVRWAIMRAVYESFHRDEEIASLGDPLVYNPRVEGWRRRRMSDPQKYWWQGVTRGRLDNAIEFITEDVGPNGPRIVTFGDFERRFKTAASEGGEAEKTLGVFANALFDFTPATRPIYWRLLAIQATLYDGMSEIGYNRDLGIDSNDVAGLLRFTPELQKQFDVDGAERVESVAQVVHSYIGQYLAPTLKRIGRPVDS